MVASITPNYTIRPFPQNFRAYHALDAPKIGVLLLMVFTIGKSFGQQEDLKKFAAHHASKSQPPDSRNSDKDLALGEAKRLGEEVFRLYRQGKYREALPLAERVLEIRLGVLGQDHPLTARARLNLGAQLVELGDFSRSEVLYFESLKSYEKSLSPEHSEVADVLNNLAELYRLQGRYPQAEPLQKRALAIREKNQKSSPQDIAQSLNNLALLYANQGRYGQAEPLYLRALAILNKSSGPKHPWVAKSLNNLAELNRVRGEWRAAEVFLLRALEILEANYGPDHLEVSIPLNNLAILYKNQGRFDMAESFQLRALRIREKILGKDHPEVAIGLNNLGLLYRDQALYSKVEPNFQRVLNILEQSFGEESPQVATALDNFAMLHQAQGRLPEALAMSKKAKSIIESHLKVSAIDQSELHQQKYLEKNRHVIDRFLDISAESKSNAYADILNLKGALFIRQKLQLFFAHFQGEGRETLEKIQDTSRQLGQLFAGSPLPGNAKLQRAKIAELTAKFNDLEVELARISGAHGVEKKQAQLNAEDIQKFLPPGTILIDFFEYDHNFPPKNGDKNLQWQLRYLVWVVRPGKPVVQIPLGSAEEINALVADWRRGIRQRVAPVHDERDPALALREKLLTPLMPYLDGVDTLLISPDSHLGTLPFAALPGKDKSKYLLEEMQVAVVPFAQALPDLVEIKKEAGPGSLVALGDVAYGADPGRGPTGAVQASRGSQGGLWAPLPGTRGEVKQLAKIYQGRFGSAGAELLEGDKATEQAVRLQAPKSRWLHLATHGYFSPPEVLALRASEKGGALSLSGERDRLLGNLPGLLSGIVLAGANQPPGLDKDDGILTATEVSSLDLTGVEQAVLSACETGLGKTAGGEGLLGLQRAFQLAGCRTVVASLWQVPDKATKDLMTRYYENLWEKKMPKGQALREAQLWLLREGKEHRELFARGLEVEGAKDPKPAKVPIRTPPVYWAAWTLSGAWR